MREARRLFLQRGFADVSVGEVAEAVGVTKPTLYYHFGDKEGLYAAVLCDLMAEVGGYVHLVTRLQLSVRQRLVELAAGYFVHADATMEPMLRDASELIGAKHAAEVRQAYENGLLAPTRDLMAEGIASGELNGGDPPMLVRAFLGLLDAFIDPAKRDARDEAEHRQIANLLVGLFLDGAAHHE